MASSLRKLLPLLLLALAATLVAACGSSDSSKTVPPGAVALVGDKAIEKADLDRLLAQTKTNYEAQKQEFPEVGTPQYETLKSTLLKGLVQQAQWEQAGAAMGVRVSDKEIDTRLDALKQQYFKGDEDKFKAELDKQGLTVEQLREQLRARVLSDKIYSAVIKKVKVRREDQGVLRQPQGPVLAAGIARGAAYPRQVGVARRRALREAQERRRLRAARPQVHPGRGVKGRRRQLHGLQGEDGCTLRQVRLRREERRPLEADQDRVRLAPDRGALRGQAGGSPAACGSEGHDQRHAPAAAAERGPEGLGEGRPVQL